MPITSPTNWTGNGSNTTVLLNVCTANTSDSNYQIGGDKITTNTVSFKVSFLPDSDGAGYGYGITYNVIPDDSDDIVFGCDWYISGATKKLRVKESGVTKADWTWQSGFYLTIVITAGTVVYKLYNSEDTQQDTYTSASTFDNTAQNYYLAVMQGKYSVSSNVTSLDTLGTSSSGGTRLPPPPIVLGGL